LALAFSAAYAALLWLLARGHGWLASRVLGATQRQAGRLHIGGAENLLAERVGVIVPRVLRLLLWGLGLLLTYIWLGEVLALFPYTRVWGERLHDYLLGVLGQVGGAVLAAVPNLVIALLILLIARFVTDLVRSLFDRVASGHIQIGWLDRDLANTTRRLANFAVWMFALAMAYPYLPGAQTDAFRGLSVLVGVMISLGASNLVGQIASGLILTYSRVVRRGEFVRVAEHEGTVTEMGMFATRIRTGMGEELTLPNSLILGTVTKNYSRAVKGQGFIVDTTVTIGYDTPWRQVVAMLVEAARRTDGVLADPAPHVFQVALSDFYPEYRLVCQAVPSQPRPRVEVINALHANIQDVFNEYGVQIMSPHYLGDPATAKVVAQQDWHLPPARAAE
jgi:small-conductance mechanosensitive channel